MRARAHAVGRGRGLAAVVGAATLLVVAPSCDTIEPYVWSRAPLNACPEHPCDRWGQDGTRPQCSDGRCEVFGRPDYPVLLVVDVPDASFFGAGHTFVLRSDDPPNRPSADCPAATCLRLPALVGVAGTYAFTADASRRVGMPFTSGGSTVPAKVRFVPLPVAAAPTAWPREVSLPVGTVVTQAATLPALEGEALAFGYTANLPAGRYLRIVEPARPLDEAFPPFRSELRVVAGATATPTNVRDDVTVGGAELPLDDPSGAARTATVRRAAGLDGFRVWLVDRARRDRVSSLRPLAGTEATVRLDTVGQSATGSSALREDVDIVVAPPEAAVAVPRLESRLFAGQIVVEYPALSPPVEVSGRVLDAPGASRGAPAQVAFRSRSLDQSGRVQSDLLKYDTVVATDAEGRFSTVLPRGRYTVVVDGDEARGLARTSLPLEVTSTSASVELVPARRTRVAGRVALADGRPLAEAEIQLAPAARLLATGAQTTAPRPVRARADEDGAFVAEVDPGEHDLVVVPRAGTGVPRFVRANLPLGGPDVDLGLVSVPAPVRYAFTLRDPFENRIARATVRAFAVPASGGVPVEVGLARTDAEGRFELLLAGQPR